MESEYRIFRINDEGKGDFIWQFHYLSEHSQGPIVKALLNAMKGDGVYRCDVCLPNVLFGDVLKYSSTYIDLDPILKNVEASPSYIAKVMLSDDEIGKTVMHDVADEWLANTALRYLSCGTNRVCVVLDMSCWSQLQPDSLREEMNWYFRKGQDEGCYVFHRPEDISCFRECIYAGIMMSYGFFATLPDSVPIEDLMRDRETPMSTEMAEMLARNADAVYVGSHDALRYMIGWFNPESIPY